jgi:ABC-type uncharacterized transport system permease subunit
MSRSPDTPGPASTEPTPPQPPPGEQGTSLEAGAVDRVVQIVSPFVAVLFAVLVGSLIVLAAGQSPVEAFSAMFQGAFGSQRAIGETLLRATPLIFTGLAVAYGFRAGLFNIGAEGQLFLGGLAAAYFGIALGGLSWWLSVPLILLLSALFGAAWAFIPAIMKARIGAHEVITTMMFSYIGRYLVSYLVTGPLRAEGGIPQTTTIAESSQLPRLSEVLGFLQPTRAHFGILLGIGIAFVIWAVLKYTVIGYEARAVGFNRWASETGGISVGNTIVKSLCISGGLAGLAGAVEVMGVHDRLFDQFSSGFGFTGIAVALLAKNNPIAVIPSAILFGALSAGAGTMQLEAGVSQKLILIIQALVIFFVGAEAVVGATIKWARGRSAASNA